jgi:hypothetical protein
MAKVRADGTLIADQVKGSIHKVGARAGRRAVLQRLDLLAFPPRRTDGAHRRVCDSRSVPRWRRKRLAIGAPAAISKDDERERATMRLNADFTKRVVIRPEDYDWVSRPPVAWTA